MELDNKIYVLNQIHRLYERFSADLSLACKPSCCHCCTANVTLTTLEGYMIVDHAVRFNQLEVLNKIYNAKSRKRFQPKLTTNMLADLCASGQPIPEEHNETSWGECPVLEDHMCPIYESRPFGCRCFVSEVTCGNRGCAHIDPFVLSVNTLFLQFLEHIDADGYTANFIDMLIVMQSDNHREQYHNGRLKLTGDAFIPNRPIRVLYTPPEHRERIEPILKSLQSIRVPV